MNTRADLPRVPNGNRTNSMPMMKKKPLISTRQFHASLFPHRRMKVACAMLVKIVWE